jgi:hypothetical protein
MRALYGSLAIAVKGGKGGEGDRKGKIAEAFRAFKKIYLELVDEVIDHLKSEEAGDSSARS